MIRGSGCQSPTWHGGTLTSCPGAVDVDQAPDLGGSDTERARRSSAIGTDDDCCHILVGSPAYRYTSCGKRLKPPLPIGKTHAEPPCPNGNEPCPDCVSVRQEEP